MTEQQSVNDGEDGVNITTAQHRVLLFNEYNKVPTNITLGDDSDFSFSESESENELDEEIINTTLRLPGRKYIYECPIDEDDGDRATGFNLLTIGRPHMRVMWANNFSCRCSLFLMFSAVILQDEMQETLKFSESQTWNAEILSISGAALSRILMGLAFEKYGARLPLVALVVFGCLCVAITGAVYNETSFYVLRFLTGLCGGGPVLSSLWIRSIFTNDLFAGLNGFTSGMGVAIGIVTVGLKLICFPVLKHWLSSSEKAWRFSFLALAFFSTCVAAGTYFLTDDTPRGNLKDLKKTGDVVANSTWFSFSMAVKNTNVWILSLQHSYTLGFEFLVYTLVYDYFVQEFDINPLYATILAAFFPLLNQWCRTAGGRLNDKMYKKHGMKGRIKAHLFASFASGFLLIALSAAEGLTLSIVIFVSSVATSFVAQSSVFGVAAYVNEHCQGGTFGIIGAFGALGGIGLNIVFRYLPFRQSFFVTAVFALFTSFLGLFIRVPGHGTLWINEEMPFYLAGFVEGKEAKTVNSTMSDSSHSSSLSSA